MIINFNNKLILTTMKKPKRLLLWIVMAFLMLSGFSSTAQTYTCKITNATQVSCNVYEFDVIMQRTGGTILRLAQFQLGISVNPAIIPSGGVLNVAPVPGSSALLAAQQPGPEKFVFDASNNCIKVAPVAPPGFAGATLISNLAAGTKLTRIRVACSLPFVATTNPGNTWNFTAAPAGYPTKMFAYVGASAPGVNTDITVQASHTLVAPYNPTLTNSFGSPIAQTVTSDVTEVCLLPGAGATISLSNTQAGYSYYLYNDGIAVSGNGGVIFGTGSAASFGTLATGSVISVKSASCAGTVDMLNTISLTPLTPVTASVSIAANTGTTVAPGTSVTYTATPVNGGSGGPGFQWFVNGTADLVNGLNDIYIYTPVNGDQVYCEMYSSETCLNNPTATSNNITMTVASTPAPTAYAVTGTGSYCQGAGGLSVGLASSEVGVTYTLFKNTVAQVPTVAGNGSPMLNAWPAQLAGTYTVSGTNGGGTTLMTGNAVITENPTLPVSVSIAANPGSTICAGTNVIFTATPANGGSTPAYQWKLNGGNVGSNSTTYSNNALVNTDVVTCVLTSNAVCTTGSPATSNTVAMTVNPVVAASVTNGVSQNNVCAGTSVTFTASPTGGGPTPTYQWYKNTVAVATGATYTYAPANNDAVYVVMTSNAICATGSPATSNTVTMVVNPLVAASVSNGVSQNGVCTGTSVTFTATPTGGGATPTYQWYKNTVAVSTGATYTYVPANNDVVYVVMTSNAVCASGSPATSNSITMIVNTTVAASVTNGVSQNNVCAGTSVTFTAAPTGGGATPTYQWYKNTVAVVTGASYSYVPANGDNVYVVMTSSSLCSTGSPATSNTVTMVVNPVIAASVTNGVSQNNVCTGTSVTFTATPTGGGAAPTYQWYKNTVAAATGASYTYAPANNDAVYVVMTSNAVCATGSPATSNTVTMVVNANVTPTFTQLGPYIQNNGTGMLQSTSLNGITGTWNPSSINTSVTGSVVYTFTPNGGQCAVPATMTIVIDPAPFNTVTWTGGANSSDPNNSNNWDGNVGANTTVIIPGGKANYPTINASVGTIAGLVIESGGSIIDNGNYISVTGPTTVKRTIADAGDNNWHLFISPVNESTQATAASSFNGAYVDGYNEATGAWDRLATNAFVTSGQGYSINYLAGSRDLVFTGTLKSSPVSYTNLSFTAPGSAVADYGAGWHLVGNPYPSGINPALCAAPVGMNAFAYVWNGGNYITPSIGNAGVPGTIASLQGFFVRTTGATNNLTLANAAKVHGGTFYKSSNSASQMLSLSIEGNNYSDKTYIRFNTEATANFDQAFDAYKRAGLDAAPQLYSIIPGEKAAVNTLPDYALDPNVSLGLKVGASTSYTINVSGIESFDASLPIRLDDLKLGTSQDLRLNPVYSFTAAPGDAENRFMLSFASVTALDKQNRSGINMDAANGTIRITHDGPASGTVYLYSVSGQLLATSALNAGETRLRTASAGVFMVKVVTGKTSLTRKMVVVQ